MLETSAMKELNESVYRALCKISKLHLISSCWNFVRTHSFHKYDGTFFTEYDETIFDGTLGNDGSTMDVWQGIKYASTA